MGDITSLVRDRTMRGRTAVPAVILAVVLAVLAAGCRERNVPRTAQPDCDIQKGPCVAFLGDTRVTLDITPRPVAAMRELRFRVLLNGHPAPSERLTLDLSMPGMRMGENTVLLARTDGDTYEGRGVIVRCPTGRSLWRATVVISGNESVHFTFRVKDGGDE